MKNFPYNTLTAKELPISTRVFIPLGIFLLLLFRVAATAQSGQFNLIREIKQPSKYFVTDKLQQFYLVSPENELIKYDANQNIQFRYYDRTLGAIGHIDATNPFQILVYYPDFQTVVWLDRTLNQLGSVKLSTLGYFQIEALGISNDNLLWLFDNLNFQLKKIDNQGRTILTSPDLSSQLIPLEPVGLQQREDRVYVNNPALGILVFDNFGQWVQTLDFTHVHNFQVLNDILYFQQDDSFFAYHLPSKLLQKIPLPKPIDNTTTIRIQKNHLYIRTALSVAIYEII